jgi:hypothetical protein
MKPSPQKPRIIIAQVEGSGTEVVNVASFSEGVIRQSDARGGECVQSEIVKRRLGATASKIGEINCHDGEVRGGVGQEGDSGARDEVVPAREVGLCGRESLVGSDEIGQREAERCVGGSKLLPWKLPVNV